MKSWFVTIMYILVIPVTPWWLLGILFLVLFFTRPIHPLMFVLIALISDAIHVTNISLIGLSLPIFTLVAVLLIIGARALRPYLDTRVVV